MNMVWKSAATAALLGAVALASATPGEARNRWVGPAAVGFAAGTVVGAGVANAYAYAPGTRYVDPAYGAYAYQGDPAYGAYAYQGAAPVYASPRYYSGPISSSNGCVTEGNYGQGIDESACNQ
jgi:hypothetical protein